MQIFSKNLLAFAALLTLVHFFSAQGTWNVEESDDVAVLTDKNFDSFLSKHPLVFVKFYAPWCGHCKKMAPDYSELARHMKGQPNGVPIAKLDGTVEKTVAGRFGIQGYPTLKLFKNGQAIDYKGAREKQPMIDWITAKANAQTRRIESGPEFQELKDQRLAGLYVLPEGDAKAIENFSAFALQFDNIQMAYSHKREFAVNMGAKSPYVFLVFRNFDDGHKVVESKASFSVAELNEQFTKVRFGIVMELDSDSSEKMNNDRKPTMILFTEDRNSPLLVLLKEIAPSHQTDFAFAYASLTSETGRGLAEKLGVTTENSIRLIGFKSGGGQKYKPENNSKESLLKLLEEYKAGKARQYMKTESIPVSNDRPVKIVVGASFGDLVLKSDKYVLLEAYAPWCGHCKRLEPIYDELARKLSNVGDLVIAKIDAVANEHPKLKAEGFPTILFYKKNRKDTPITFKGNRDIDGFMAFLEKEMGRKLLEVKTEDL